MKFSVALLTSSLVSSVVCYFGSDSFYEDEFMTSNSGKREFDGSGFDIRRIECEFSTSKVLLGQLKRINDILITRNLKFGNQRSYVNRSSDLHLEESLLPGELYALFNSCSYLVNPLYFTSYQNMLHKGEFSGCYYILLKTVKPDNFARKYIEVLEINASEELEKISNAIYICDKNIFVSVNLECYKNRKICLSDMTLDICKIYKLNLSERKKLIECIFQRHFYECGFDFGDVRELTNIYEKTFLLGKEQDIKFTSFIIYYLYSDLIAGNFNRNSYERLLHVMRLYEKKADSALVYLEFLIKVACAGCQ